MRQRFGTIQPEKVEPLIGRANDGLMSRFLWFWPEATDGFDAPPDIRHIEAAGADRLCRLADLGLAPGAGEDEPPQPVPLPFEPGATDAIVALARRMKERGRDFRTHGLMRSAYGKAHGQALKLAVVLEHLWWCGDGARDAPPPKSVGEEAAKAAVTLVKDYFLPQAERIYICQATSRFTRYGDTHIYQSARRSRRLDEAAPASSPGLLQRVLQVTQPVAPPPDVQHMARAAGGRGSPS